MKYLAYAFLSLILVPAASHAMGKKKPSFSEEAALFVAKYSEASPDQGGSCVDDQGNVKRNPGFLGECGDLSRRDLTSGPWYRRKALNRQDRNFNGISLRYSALNESNVSGSTFRGADLGLSEFRGAELIGVDMSHVDLTQVYFEDAVLIRGWFVGANLDGAYMDRAKAMDADFRKADLEDAQLDRADFSGAILVGADLDHAFAPGAKFVGADLRGAILYKVDLTGANLSDSDLRWADLRAYSDGGTVLTGALFNEHTALPFDRQTAEAMGMIYVPANGEQLTMPDLRPRPSAEERKALRPEDDLPPLPPRYCPPSYDVGAVGPGPSSGILCNDPYGRPDLDLIGR